MLRYFLFRSIFLIGFIPISCMEVLGQGECLGGGCTGGSQYPSATQSTSTSSWTTVTTTNYAGEYGVYNITNGKTYEWSLCSANGGAVSFDGELTLLNSTGITKRCYSDDYCGSAADITYTATATETVRVLITEFNCLTNSTNTTIVWRCTDCGSGSAPPNDNCSGATNLTVNAAAIGGTVDGASNSVVTGCAGTSEDDVWYKFTTTTAGYYTITVDGSANFDAVVDFRSGACNGSNVSCEDNSYADGIEVINASLSATTTYYVRVYDYYGTPPGTKTFTIKVEKPTTCIPSYTYGFSDGDYINNVTVGTINNTTGAGPANYNDYYATASTNLQAGTNQTLIVTVGTYGGQTIAAWIDYNNDNDFVDAGETLGEIANIAASSAGVINFNISAGVSTGNKRMRVRTVYSGASLDPCAGYSYGEAEDYKVNITAACITPGDPASLSTSGITISQATLNWSAGSPAGSATVTYYWAIGAASNVTYEANYLFRGTTTSLTATQASLSPGTTYYWTVKAVTSCNGTISSYASAISFNTSCTTPGTPTALNTTGITTTSAYLNWTASGTGSPTISYYWAVGAASGVTYESGYVQRGIVTGTSVNVFGLTQNTTYYWNVKAVTSCNASASSYPSAISFTTLILNTPLVTWTGNGATTGNKWVDVNNWDIRVPLIGDHVLIPDVSGGSSNFPDITAGGLSVNNSNRTNLCKSLTIASNAKLTIISTLDFDITGIVNLSGVLNHRPATIENKFKINSGGIVTVKNGAYLNIGSTAISAGLPGGSIDPINDLQINAGGKLVVEPGGTVFVQDALDLQTSGIFMQEGGVTSICYSGAGTAASDKVSVPSGCTFRITGGTFRVSGDADGTTSSWDAIWFGSGSTIDIQGGTMELLNGTTANDFTLSFAQATTLNNLTINKTGKTVLLDGYNVSVNGDILISAGTINANGYNNTLAGNFTNNGTYTAGSGTLTLTGNGKLIDGSSETSFNTVTLNSGASYTINPSYVTVPQVTISGNLNINSGATLTLATTKIINLAGTTNTISGTLTAVDKLDNTRDIGFNNAGGTVTCSGSLNADIQISSGVTTLTTDMTLNGDMFVNTGNFVMSTHTLTLYGNWTNNGNFTHGTTDRIIFAGSSKNITGSAADGSNSWLNNVTIQAGASYTFNPTVATNWDIDGSFFNYGTLTLASGKYLDIYGSTAGGESIILDGTITAATPYDATRDLDINSTVVLSGSGTTNADLRIYSGTTTLSSNFTLGGNFTINSGAGFTMTTHQITVGGDWKAEDGTFTRGTGTVIFNGNADRTLRTGSTQTGGTINNNFFNNLIVLMAPSATLTMDRKSTFDTTNALRVIGDLIIQSGTFSTGGSAYVGRKLRSDKLTNIYQGAVFNIGGSSSEASYGNWVTEFRGDLLINGSITTSRPVKSGYAEIFLFGARITGLGNPDEVGCDVQMSIPATVYQLGDVNVQGDMIIQTSATYECTGGFDLGVGGTFYVYENLTHNGNVTCKGNFRDQSGGSYPVNSLDLTNSTFNFEQAGTKYISFAGLNPVTFNNFNVVSASGGTREIRNDIIVNGHLKIEAGEVLDAYVTSPKNITLSESISSWINMGTFTPRTGTVTFNGDGTQTIAGSSSTSFYNLTVNKGSSSAIDLQKSTIVTNNLNLTAGYITTTSSKLLTLNDGSSISYPASPGLSFVRGPIKKIGATNGVSFVFPVGKDSRSARIAVTPTSTSATNEFTAEYFDDHFSNFQTVSDPITQVSTMEYWQLDRGGASPVNAAVTLFWEDAGWSGINSCASGGNLVVSRWTGAIWEDRTNSGGVTGTCSGASAGTVKSNTVTSFSPFTFASKSSAVNPLPVELLTFDAKLNGSKVDLFWTTATEINNDYFTVQRSRDMESFENIATVQGAGNSSTLINYSSVDKNPVEGVSYYRLMQTDFDGTKSYSNVVPITISRLKEKAEQSISLQNILVYPNPGEGLFNINFENREKAPLQFLVYDITGRQVRFDQKTLEEGNVQTQIDLRELIPGTYILVVQTDDQRISHKLIIQK